MVLKIHPREKKCTAAESELRGVILGLDQKHKLTQAELIQVLTHVFSDEILSMMKYAIRQERHGNTDTPGGLA